MKAIGSISSWTDGHCNREHGSSRLRATTFRNKPRMLWGSSGWPNRRKSWHDLKEPALLPTH